MKRQDTIILIVAMSIALSLAVSCVKRASKERVWRDGLWIDKAEYQKRKQ
jgi:hypothetical protein